ncbi:helix-turn-helix domain-containing protein [Halococcus sp. IIIV-5B]|uniref:helix-turn-helix domain-containing protein n=1 Tax=Halococcus sp. IIIV-5B TaxID=2321230 RepID=UPI000E76E521|nr:hypothetical protein D3261_10435 [Halococcus sp. IIIV-5B]
MDTSERNPLTDEQHRFLRTALEEGYFRVPRETTLVALGEEHGISSQEASELVREGIEVVLRNQFDDQPP